MTRARPWKGAAGQTTTEYLMIAGLMAAIIVTVFVFYWQSARPSAREWVNRVRCAIAGSMLNDACGGAPGDSAPPPSATASGSATASAGGPATTAAGSPPAAGPPPAATPPPPPEFKFENPQVDGVPLGGGGQAAADMYCRRMGYGRATGYVEDGIAMGSSRNIVTGETCWLDTCPGFYTITCTP